MTTTDRYPHANITKKYEESSISARLEACFLDNLGKVITREQLLEVARDPVTKQEPENWHHAQ